MTGVRIPATSPSASTPGSTRAEAIRRLMEKGLREED